MEKNIRAKNNRTITLTQEERELLQREILVEPPNLYSTDWIDRVFNTDLFDILDYIPNQITDLIILDPPYNLSKNYNGLSFNARSNEAYRSYLEFGFHKKRGGLCSLHVRFIRCLC